MINAMNCEKYTYSIKICPVLNDDLQQYSQMLWTHKSNIRKYISQLPDITQKWVFTWNEHIYGSPVLNELDINISTSLSYEQ